jgi:hypothetical protein
MPFAVLCRVAVAIIYVSERISPPSSGFLSVIGFHSCVTVESLFMVEELCLVEWSHDGINDRCLSGENRRFGERIASIFRVP